MLDNKNLNKHLIRLVVMLGITLVMGGIALVIAYGVKAKFGAKNEDNMTTLVISSAINDNFSTECQPLTIEYRENYIAINSKKCSKVLIINTNTGREIYKKY
ncbi:MAG: hypothetical protein LBQ34_02800 [Alphaproteobacteria bacterium]|jgi:predicted phage tail protein|nr:hypothetical protein [Alphaproteobacteria bacterium]